MPVSCIHVEAALSGVGWGHHRRLVVFPGGAFFARRGQKRHHRRQQPRTGCHKTHPQTGNRCGYRTHAAPSTPTHHPRFQLVFFSEISPESEWSPGKEDAAVIQFHSQREVDHRRFEGLGVIKEVREIVGEAFADAAVNCLPAVDALARPCVGQATEGGAVRAASERATFLLGATYRCFFCLSSRRRYVFCFVSSRMASRITLSLSIVYPNVFFPSHLIFVFFMPVVFSPGHAHLHVVVSPSPSGQLFTYSCA